MAIEVRKMGLEVKCQHPITVYYESEIVGEYFADLIINGIVVIELKASKSMLEENECQLINYLKATKIELGLLMNFGKEAEYKRKVFMNKFSDCLNFFEKLDFGTYPTGLPSSTEFSPCFYRSSLQDF